jgi:hypothetical protein
VATQQLRNRFPDGLHVKSKGETRERTFALWSLTGSLFDMFPSIKDPELVHTRLKNVGRQVYLCVVADDTGNYILHTKTRNLESISDPERKYSRSFFFIKLLKATVFSLL